MNFSKHWAAVLDDYVIDLAWSPDGSTLAAASAAGGIKLFDAESGSIRQSLAGHEAGANCLAWLPDGTRLATGGNDGQLRLWEPASGQPTAGADFRPAWVEHLQCGIPASPRLFAAAGRKLTAIGIDGATLHRFPDAPKSITALAATPAPGAPTPLLAASYFGGVCVWNAGTAASFKEYTYGNTIHALLWSPDGRWLVAGCQDNAVHLWVPAEDIELHMSGYETKLKELSFSHDSRWLATGGGRDACVWDCAGAGPEGREPQLLPHSARVCAIAFQHQHSLLASGDASGIFTLWAPTRKNPMVAEATMPSPATKLAWHPDDRLLAVGTEQGQLYVFKTA